MSCVKYDQKLIISGSVYEHLKYEVPRVKGYKVNKGAVPADRARVASIENKIINRKKVTNISRFNLMRLINTNVLAFKDSKGITYEPKFVTFTFAENIQDLKKANKEFDKFRKRLNRYLGYTAEYNIVVEFQKRGAVHYHIVFYNLPFIPAEKLAEIWGQGFIKINKLKDVDNIGVYVCKYMSKDFDVDKLVGEKCYFSSRGLKKPEVLIEKTQVESVRSALPESSKTFENTYQNDYTGKVEYTQYNLKRVCTDV